MEGTGSRALGAGHWGREHGNVTSQWEHQVMARPQLTVVGGDTSPATALEFSESVRTVVQLARRGGLVPPVFRSPPSSDSVDRTIRRRGTLPPVVSIRRRGRPLPAIQADVIEAIVVANDLDAGRADRFRRAAWTALAGSPVPMGTPDRTGPPVSARTEHVA